MKYEKECCRCGLCCLNEMCPIGIGIYGIHKFCPALSFDENGIASCRLAMLGMVPIGDGCCIKARAYKDGVGYNYATLPNDKKYEAVRQIRNK